MPHSPQMHWKLCINMPLKQATQGILTLPQYDWESGNLVDRGCLLDLFYNPVPNLDPSRQEVAMVIGACLWIPRKVWLNLAGFPEWFESIAEDMHICCLARLQGITVEVTGSSSYRHRQGKSFGGNRSSDGQLNSTLRRRKLSERNKTFVLAVCTPFPLQTTAILLHLLALLIEGAFISLLSRKPYLFSDIYLAAIIDLFKNIKKISAERTRIYRERLCSTSKFFRHFTVVPQKIRLLKKYGIPRVKLENFYPNHRPTKTRTAWAILHNDSLVIQKMPRSFKYSATIVRKSAGETRKVFLFCVA